MRGRESIVLRTNIPNFDGFTYFVIPWIRKITFLASSRCKYVCICVCVLIYYQPNCKAKCRKNSKFDFLHLHYTQMLLETFYEGWKNNLHTNAHKEFENITDFRQNFSLAYFKVFRLHWIWWNEHAFLAGWKICNQ